MNQRNNRLLGFRVMLHDEPGDKFKLAFDCQAEDADHAEEQAKNAYPGFLIVHTLAVEDCIPTLGWFTYGIELVHPVRPNARRTNIYLCAENDALALAKVNDLLPGCQVIAYLSSASWLRKLKVNDWVWWKDPAGDVQSGFYQIEFIALDNISSPTHHLMLRHPDGHTCAACARDLVQSFDAGIMQLDVDRIAAHFRQRIEDGDLPIEDMPILLARYGLVDPLVFREEMQERIEGYCDITVEEGA